MMMFVCLFFHLRLIFYLSASAHPAWVWCNQG